MILCVYDIASGRPVRAQSSGTPRNDESTEIVLPVNGSASNALRATYFDGNNVVLKEVPVATADKLELIPDGNDEITISGLSPNAHVRVYLREALVGTETVNDGSFEFSTDQEGQYTIEIDCVEYLKQVIQIEAFTTN